MAESPDDRFTPKLGRIRRAGGKRTKSYLNRVLNQISAAGQNGFVIGVGSKQFTGTRIGRGNQVMQHRRVGHSFGPSYRRVVIKTRIVKLKGGGIGAASAHMRYLQREGVAQNNEPGQLYNANSNEADGKALLERSEGDRHQFRFILSAEGATELADLKPFVRDLMQTMEHDLSTKLDWVAVDHFNTGQPHTHIVVRGKDDQGKDLVIARDYIAQGMRRRASEIVTLELGPQTEHELIQKFQRQINQERFTDLDRELVREAGEGGLVAPDKTVTPADRFKQAFRMRRLHYLERLGLAQETHPGEWRLSPKLESTLRRASERGDIIKTLHRALKQAGLDAGASELAIYDPAYANAKIVTGQIVDRGLHDELKDGHYVVVDGADGRLHYVALDPKQDMDDLPVGTIVEVHPASKGVKPSDLAISEIAAGNGGIYSPVLHQAHDPKASSEYVQAHVRRLEALRRVSIVHRFEDGSWEIPDDYQTRVAKLVQDQARYPGQLVLLSAFSLDQQVTAEGATWLDRQLVGSEVIDLRGNRFGKTVEDALLRRQDHLVEQGLAEWDGKSTRYQRNLLMLLQRRELLSAGERLAAEMKLEFVEAHDGQHISGIYKRPVHLASGKFAIIEKSKEFTLVPWRPVLERQLGKTVAGIVKGPSVSFDFSKKKGIGIS
ncbi:DUF3363 domain-containing protein [Mariluticola halotolerans]|uniref:DUF3363 domain-containing protein n=1 Tax=Mariluticola halotolerans TaxID=2909283 RepID=UPI0026E2BFB4|nr:DUF3363 domain-containing protein [Mariluticola halotolerans]UJQ94136.1 DUF3363 domain-containing protein [Mariluticola halotolerans]